MMNESPQTWSKLFDMWNNEIRNSTSSASAFAVQEQLPEPGLRDNSLDFLPFAKMNSVIKSAKGVNAAEKAITPLQRKQIKLNSDIKRIRGDQAREEHLMRGLNSELEGLRKNSPEFRAWAGKDNVDIGFHTTPNAQMSGFVEGGVRNNLRGVDGFFTSNISNAPAWTSRGTHSIPLVTKTKNIAEAKMGSQNYEDFIGLGNASNAQRTALLRDAGHSGITSGGERIMFNPNDVKALWGNNGKFSLKDNDIYKSILPGAFGVGAASDIGGQR